MKSGVRMDMEISMGSVKFAFPAEGDTYTC